MATLFVMYSGDKNTRFDRDYYVQTHLPLVMEAWGPYGLDSAAAFFPAGNGAGTIAVAVCEFRDEPAITVALTAPQTKRVMEDVPKFTDAKPSQSRAVAI